MSASKPRAGGQTTITQCRRASCTPSRFSRTASRPASCKAVRKVYAQHLAQHPARRNPKAGDLQTIDRSYSKGCSSRLKSRCSASNSMSPRVSYAACCMPRSNNHSLLSHTWHQLCLTPPSAALDWMLHKAASHHVAHHLFPSMPHHNAPEAMQAVARVLGCAWRRCAT